MSPAGTRAAGGAVSEAEAARAVWIARNGSRKLTDATLRAMLDAAAAARPSAGDDDALAGAREEVGRLRERVAEVSAEMVGLKAEAERCRSAYESAVRGEAKANAETAAAEAALAEARAVLRRVEWAATDARGANYRCPCCRCSHLNVNGVTYSHAPGCALAAALAPDAGRRPGAPSGGDGAAEDGGETVRGGGE